MILGIDASQANRKIRSGTEWYAFHLIQEFKRLLGGRGDIKVRLYTREALQSDLANNLPENFEVRILRWPLRYFWTQIRLSLEVFTNPPDVLFCPAHTIPLTSILSRKGRGRMRVFTTLHDVGFADYPELYDKLSLWYHKFSARLAIKRAAHIFTVSEFSKERIIENYNSPSSPFPSLAKKGAEGSSRGEGELARRINVTYLGIDQEKFKRLSPSEVARKLQGLGLGYNDYFLFLGRLEPKKNILGLVEGYAQALQDMPSLPELVLAGQQVDLRTVNQYLVHRPELGKKIRFLDYVAEQDKPILYNGALLFLFLTLYEGFGLPILEAQAAGTPVITSNTASNPEIAGEGAVIVSPDSPYEIAEAIKKLLADQNWREEKISLGLENVKRFDWRKTAELTLNEILHASRSE